jgi:hypothetical protein
MTGTDGQLQFHPGAAMNTELTEIQMKNFISVLKVKVGKKEADNAKEILSKAFEQQGKISCGTYKQVLYKLHYDILMWKGFKALDSFVQEDQNHPIVQILISICPGCGGVPTLNAHVLSRLWRECFNIIQPRASAAALPIGFHCKESFLPEAATFLKRSSRSINPAKTPGFSRVVC